MERRASRPVRGRDGIDSHFEGSPLMAPPVPLLPLSPDERSVITRVVDAAPPLRPAIVEEIAALLGGSR